MAYRHRQARFQAEQEERERLNRERIAHDEAERERFAREEVERQRQRAEKSSQQARTKSARLSVEPLILVPPELAVRIAPRPPAPTLFELRRRQVCRRTVRIFDNMYLT